MNTTKKAFAFIAFALLAINLHAQTPPGLTVFLERWERNFKPVNEVCIDTNICGAPNSTLPNKKTVNSLFERFDNGSTNKERTTVNVSAPVYHSQSTIKEKLITTINPSNSAGYMTITSSSNGGVTNSTSSFPITALDVGEQFAYGRLHADIYNAAGTAVNKMESFESSKSTVGIQGGSENYEFTFLLPFQVVEKTWTPDGTLVTLGIVPASEITFLSGMERTVMDLGNGVCAIMFKVIGGGGFRTHDITPACFRPYYQYSFLAPVLLEVKPVKSDTDND